jgi:hypothetical protein
VSIKKTDYAVISMADLDSIIAKAKNPDIVTLHFPGIKMWYAYDNIIIPHTIDFRETDKIVSYDDIKFDKSFSVDQFKKQFPGSAKSSIHTEQSLFGVQAGNGSYQHFIVTRKTKDDPGATPIVEFTFENDKLIYILFANF